MDGPRYAGFRACTSRRIIVPPANATGDAALPGTAPFIMHADGAGWIWVAKGLKDGPLPAHYEPFESPISNPCTRQQVNPAADPKRRARQSLRGVSRRRSISVRAHDLSSDGASHCWRHDADALASRRAATDALLRNLPGACGGSRSAARRGRHDLVAARLDRRARARHRRMRPLQVRGRTVHQVGLPYHWGHRGSRARRRRERSGRDLGRAKRQDHGIEGARLPDRAARTPAEGRPSWSSIVIDRISHRRDAVHRLQSLRSRLQGMESGPKRRLTTSPGSRTTTPPDSATRHGAT